MSVNIRGKQYLLVAERIDAFRKDHPTWTIKTELVSSDETTVVFKASILDDKDRLISTGWAEEIRSSTGINSTSALEVCETSAVGRALSFYKYAGGEIASADEVIHAIKNQAEAKEAPASEAQIKYMRQLMTKNQEKAASYMKENKVQIPGISAKQASEIINYLVEEK